MPPPPLKTAAQHASLQSFQLILLAGGKINRRTLHSAVFFAAAVQADPSVLCTADWAGFNPSKKFDNERKRTSEMLPSLFDELHLDVIAADFERQ